VAAAAEAEGGSLAASLGAGVRQTHARVGYTGHESYVVASLEIMYPTICFPAHVALYQIRSLPRHTGIAVGSRSVEHLLQALPPRRLTRLAARRTLHERLLVAVGHPPPLLHLGVLGHFFCVARPVVAHVLE